MNKFQYMLSELVRFTVLWIIIGLLVNSVVNMRINIKELDKQNVKHCGTIVSVDESYRNNDTVKVIITDQVTNKPLLMIVDKIEIKNNTIVCGKDYEFDQNVDSHHTTFIFLFIALLVLGMIGCNVLADIISYKGDKGSE